jgi:soluble lytic murein transglycosylase-like protein
VKARRFLKLTIAAVAVPAIAASSAGAAVPHTVQPGETLWSIAAANNLYTPALAAFNGMSPDAQVVLGSTVQIPSEGEALSAVNAAPQAQQQTQTQSSGAAQPAAPASGGAPPPAGGYTVRPGDTLTGIAANAGVSPQALAAMNGLSTDSQVISGTALKLPAGTPISEQPQPKPTAIPQGGPQPTSGHTNSAEISQIAAQHGVPGSLASAIAWQESGFNNSAVSSANARGVMQVMPGTWDWVQQNLASSQLNPASTQDNVKAGTLYLNQLLKDTGGDQRMAIAAYYQGLGSVRENGMLPETQRYVDNVMALQGRFGGP